MDRVQILTSAIKKFGQNNQMLMAVEEAAELIQAINKYFRCDGKNEAVIMDLRGEIADMRIMLDQLTIMFGGTELMAVESVKIERLKRMVEND